MPQTGIAVTIDIMLSVSSTHLDVPASLCAWPDTPHRSSLLILFSCLCCQGCHQTPLSFSFRNPFMFLLLLFFNIYSFLRDGERQNMSGRGTEREGDTDSEAGSRLRAVSTEPDAGLELNKPRDHDLSRSRTLNRLSHPAAPISVQF